jgi:succinate dehydrogenase/fumarate reductase cytochrome b subunit
MDQGLARPRPAVERLLAFSGAVPLPVFLILHLGGQALRSAPADVSELARETATLGEMLTSLLLVWTPLVLHIALGVWSLFRRRPLSAGLAQPDLAPGLIVLSRATALLALAFVLLHTLGLSLPVWLGRRAASDSGFWLIAELSGLSFGVPLRAGAYLLGLAATLTHAGLGLQRLLLAEGRLQAPGRRKLARDCCAGACIALWALGALTVIRVASGALLS